MKPDRNPPLERLTAQMRSQGTLPERDLWPGISAAIDEVESATPVSVSTPRRRRVLWPLVAVAATLFLLVAAGWEYQRDFGLVADVEPPRGPDNELAVMDQALDELNQALAGQPADLGLTRLIQMVEQSRGDLVRMNAQGWQREIPTAPLS